MDRIFIGVKDLALSMGVSEKTIYRMLTDNQFPFAVKIGGQWRFRADSVNQWISAQTGGGKSRGSVNYNITISDALANGAVLYRIHGSNRDEALDELLAAFPRTGAFHSQDCKFSILAREALVPSSLAGIACMSPSSEHPVFMERSIIILAFLEQATDFKALDGTPARVIILILPANGQELAILHTRLQRLLMEPAFPAALMKEPPRKELLNYIGKIENRILPRRRTKSGEKATGRKKTAQTEPGLGAQQQSGTPR